VKIGSLCTGYGGLDMAVEAVFNAKTVWVSEIDKFASKLIDERWKLPNLGDLKTIDWHSVERIDILTAGYPCQPFSHAGYRKGTNDERHIFPYILEAISILRPRYAIMENVRGHLTLGFKEVLKGLAEVGYDAKWRVVRASDVGAPHQRARLFIIAYPSSTGLQGTWHKTNDITNGFIANTDSHACEESRRANRGIRGTTSEVIDGSDRQKHRSCCEASINTCNQFKSHDGQVSELGSRFTSRREMQLQDLPNTLDQLGRLNPVFVEYMMGLPKGWVTDLDISRSQQLKMLGNGVVPQQAEYAIHQLLKCDTPF